jgi:hypothetical protein
VADALVAPGCPLCRIRHDAARGYLESLLWDNVTDTRVRQRLAAGRGFCRAHVHELLKTERGQAGGTVGTAILLAASLRVRLAEIERIPTGDSRGSRAGIEQARRQARCPVCEAVASSEAIAVSTLVDKSGEPSWSHALGSADWCVDDLLALWSTAVERGADAWPAIAAAQVARMRALADRLESFVHHSSHDRRHLLTDEERRASDEAAAILGGSPARPKSR